MAVQGINYADKNWFVSRHDPGQNEELEQCIENGATIFWWGAIPNLLMTRIADQQTSSSVTVGTEMTQTFNQKTATRNREAFRYGIREPGFDNFPDPNGGFIKAEWDDGMEGGRSFRKLTDETLDKVPLYLVQEVGAHIFNSNSLGEDGRKKLEAALSHSEGSHPFDAMSAMTLPGASGGARKQRSSTGGRKATKRKTSTGKTPRPSKTKAGAPDA